MRTYNLGDRFHIERKAGQTRVICNHCAAVVCAEVDIDAPIADLMEALELHLRTHDP